MADGFDDYTMVKAIGGPGWLSDHEGDEYDFGKSGAIGMVVDTVPANDLRDLPSRIYVSFVFPDKRGSAGIGAYDPDEVKNGELVHVTDSDEHPMFTVELWKQAVANGNTRDGYWRWVSDQHHAWAMFEPTAT